MHQSSSQQPKQQQQLTLLDQFKQQMLKAWQPVPSLTKTIVMFFVLSCIFLGIGVPMIILSTNIQEYSVRYDDRCVINSSGACVVSLAIQRDMAGPIFVYYQLRNYYQNHRLYSKSISYNQLKGKVITESDAQTDCEPIVYNSDLYVTTAIDGTPLNPKSIANPCGIVAYTIFNDSYSLNNGVVINDTGIAWPSDLQKFKITNASQMWYDITQERFMNWMRIASMPNFRKLWGRIQGNLTKGIYQLSIINQYDISQFNGQKYFVISQSNFFGSKNQFLSITYLVVGASCFVIGVLFLIKKIMKKSKSQ